MRDIRFYDKAMIKSYDARKDRTPLSVRVVPKEQRPPALFETMGAPSDLKEWVAWYRESRKQRGIPERGLMPAVALNLRRRKNVIVICEDDRQPLATALTDEELELF